MKKSGVKNVWKFVPVRGGVSTPNGKYHLKFPFLLSAPLPKLLLLSSQNILTLTFFEGESKRPSPSGDDVEFIN